jgi:quinol monooxygenase YgiN
MSEVQVFAHGQAAAGHEDDVREALLALVKATREEPGNLSYKLHEDPSSPGNFYLYEEYADQAALDAHMASPHFAEAVGKFGPYLAAAPRIVPVTRLA